MRTQLVLLLALLSPAGPVLAQTPTHSRPHTATPALDPVGSYDLELDMHGQVTSSVLLITREKDGSLKGTLDVHGQSIILETVSVEGHVVTLASGSELSLTLTLKDDDTLLGKWVRSDMSGSLSGVRRKG
jgi:hypothetical protein